MPSQLKKDSENTIMARISLIVNRASNKLTSAEEVLQVLKTILDDKAPGPDGIPNKVLKIAKANTKEYVDMYNACLKEGCFLVADKHSGWYSYQRGKSPRRSLLRIGHSACWTQWVKLSKE